MPQISVRIFLLNPDCETRHETLSQIFLAVSVDYPAGCVSGIPARRVLHGEEPTISFKRDVSHLSEELCCLHDARKAEGGYRIDTFAELSKPGDSGIEPLKGNADEDAELLCD